MVANPIPQAPWGMYVPFMGHMTVEQFAQLSGEPGWIYELHEGRLIVMPGPGNRHGDIQMRFALTLGAYIVQQQLGHLSGTGCFNLPLPGNTEELLCPDAAYITPTRRATMPLRGSYLVGAPDLVIEISSPSDTYPAVARKVAMYLQAGVQLVWVAWPETQTIDVWRPANFHQPIATLGPKDLLDGLDIVPGFHCAVSAIFTVS